MDNHIGQLGQIAVRSYLGGQHADERKIAELIGAAWAVPAIEAKSAVGANEVALAEDAGTGLFLNQAVDQIRSRSVTLVCQGRGSPDFGLRYGALQLDETSPVASVVDENDPTPIAIAVPHGVVLGTPNKLIFSTPLTLELARSALAATSIQNRAIDGLGRGLDSFLFQTAGSSGGSLGASADALADVYALTQLINISGSQPFVYACAPDVAAKMALLRQGGVLPFPGMSITGQGEIGGLPALSTDRVAAGSMWIIDPTGLAIHIEEIAVSATQNAAILMSTAPNLPANLTSAFQVGMIVVNVMVRFSIAVIRQQDVAGELASIEWANS